MIETLSQLAASSGISRLTVSIQPQSESRVAVTIQSILGAEPPTPTEAQKKLRMALAQPVLIDGLPGEIDAKIESILDDYLGRVRPHADGLKTNAEEAAKAVEKAGAEAAKEKAEEKGEPSATKAEQPKPDEFTSPDTDSL